MNLKEYMKNHRPIIIILIFVYIISIVTVGAEFILDFEPIRGFEIPEIVKYSGLFGPSLAASVLLISIGGYLVYRYISKPPPRKESQYQLIWGVGFLVYSLLFVGLCLQSFQDAAEASIFPFANMDDPGVFLIWRSTMIIWVVLMWIGTIMLFTESKKFIYLPAILIFVAGELWFFLRLIVIQPSATAIEQTMYGFLFGMFIPMCIVIAYLFYTYSRDLNLSSARLLTIGFSLLAITYAAWAPWHFSGLTYIYFIWFDLFNVSLAFILAGFFALPKETTSKVID